MGLVRELRCLSNTVVHVYYFGSKQCGHLVFRHLAILIQPVTMQFGHGAVRIVCVDLDEE